MLSIKFVDCFVESSLDKAKRKVSRISIKSYAFPLLYSFAETHLLGVLIIHGRAAKMGERHPLGMEKQLGPLLNFG
jgi:hypothetical protein